ncbi:MAG: phosphate-starvation-inducible PsiE family protein [Geminicoccaceae bacterium]
MWMTRAYSQFERVTATCLLAGMIVVIVLATYSFLRSTVQTALAFDQVLDYAVFQTLFDRVLAAVIALELAHSVQQMALGKHGLTQVKTVLIIGVLAVVRKLILLEIDQTSGLFLVGLSAAVLSLGAIFALVHWVERRSSGELMASPGVTEVQPEPGTPSDETTSQGRRD